MTKNKPIHEIRVGNVKASIWENADNKPANVYKISFTRLCHDGQHWRTTPNFRRDDLVSLATVSHLASIWIHERQPSAVAA